MGNRNSNQKADVLPLEQNFENTYPLYRERKDCFLTDTFEFDFNGNGFVIWGNICCTRSITPNYINRVSTRHIGSEVFGLAEPNDPYVAKVEIWIDGELDHVAAFTHEKHRPQSRTSLEIPHEGRKTPR